MISALNGRLPSTMRTVADTGANGPQTLRLDAAASWSRMLAAGMPAGCLRSGYRTLAQQSAQDPALALPAGISQHGEGLAADVDEPARSWIAAWGLPFGWRIGFVPGEPWHAQYDQPDQHLADAIPPAPTVAPSPPAPAHQEDDMAFTAKDPTGQVWHLSGVFRRPITQHQADALSVLAPPATVPFLGGIGPDALAGYADISGTARPVVTPAQ